MRNDANQDAHCDMLNLTRDAFTRERRVRIDDFRIECDRDALSMSCRFPKLKEGANK